MLSRLFLAIAALCLIAGPVLADPKPPCEDLAASKLSLKALTEKAGAGFVALDGNDAHVFLDFINKTGKPTDFHSDHIGVVLMVERAEAIVALADGACGGFNTAVRMPLAFAMVAYQKVRGMPPKPVGEAPI